MRLQTWEWELRDGLYYVFAAIVRIRISGLDQEAEGVWVMTSKCLGHNSTYSPIHTTIRTIAIVCIGEYTLLANTYYCDPQPPGPDRKCEYVLLQRIRSTIHLSTLTLKSEVSLSSLTLSKISICLISTQPIIELKSLCVFRRLRHKDRFVGNILTKKNIVYSIYSFQDCGHMQKPFRSSHRNFSTRTTNTVC